MNEPAFARPNSFLPNGDIGCVSQQGISQRRLLAGMICSGMMSGIVGMPDQEWKAQQIDCIVNVAVSLADELIKQTEET